VVQLPPGPLIFDVGTGSRITGTDRVAASTPSVGADGRAASSADVKVASNCDQKSG